MRHHARLFGAIIFDGTRRVPDELCREICILERPHNGEREADRFHLRFAGEGRKVSGKDRSLRIFMHLALSRVALAFPREIDAAGIIASFCFH